MKYLILFLFLIGCTTIQANTFRQQIDACHSHGLHTLVFKTPENVTLMVMCTVPDSEADEVVEVEIISDIIEMVK